MPFRVAPEKSACYQLHLRFFDFDACVRSDDGKFIDLFARMYRRFLVDSDSPAGQPLVEFALLAKTDLPGGLGEPVPVSRVVVLTDPAEAKCTANNEEVRQELSVMVDRADEALVNAINCIPGMGEVKINAVGNYPTIKICALRPIYTLSQVESLCKIYGVLILDVIRGKEGRPTFESPAVLAPISATEAVIELLKRFQGGYKSALLQGEFGGSPSRLFMELSTIIGQAQCYQLSVGPLKQMASLVCNCIN